ncbi:MAG TPA: TetR/AcrR family transcriptional regulator [Acetobacteraceae bacterium]|nr:TetR/AcrR family transcriptional regulator [Acetobacteraceae bacterium]
MARPREFDVDSALCAALDVFWRQGFEGASLTDLTKAMGITRPSLYAAFGNKETLFRKALDRYYEVSMGFVREALAEPRLRGALEKLLYGYADAFTDATHPAGCLTTNGALACSEAAEPVRLELVTRREADEAALRARLAKARAAGELPPESDPAALAAYLMAIIQGMAVQAASGAGRDALYGIIATTLRAGVLGAVSVQTRIAKSRKAANRPLIGPKSTLRNVVM